MNSSPPRHRRDRNVERRLSRAIETAWLALQELDALWVPIIKSWRLNERMYGALTGLSKKAILGEHGADSAWRKSRRWRLHETPSFRTQVRRASSSGAAGIPPGRPQHHPSLPRTLVMTSATSAT